MADSAAERSRRAYRHRKGDHSLCDPQRRCESVAGAEARGAAAQSAVGGDGEYGQRGTELRSALAGAELGPAHKLLVDEAARIADRLDRLDSALNNRGTWLRFEPTDGGEIVVTIDNVLAEARQQASALKGIVAELRAVLPVGKPETAPKAGGLSALADELAARRRPSAG